MEVCAAPPNAHRVQALDGAEESEAVLHDKSMNIMWAISKRGGLLLMVV